VFPKDFLAWSINQLLAGKKNFDGVVGNPPFVRYQYLDKAAQIHSEAIFKILGLPFTKHTNAWVPFVLASVAMLKPGGRLGMILPSELIHVRHARPLRTYLGTMCSRLLIIDPEEIWFENTLQGAVILLAEKKSPTSDYSYGVGVHQVSGDAFLSESSEDLFSSVQRINGQTVAGKWTRALLSQQERNLLDKVAGLPEVHEFRDIANVDVGIVTGANDFFLVDDDTVATYGLEQYAYPMFGRSGHCPGVVYDEAQHKANAESGYPTNFLWFDEAGERVSKKTKEYIALGETQDLHNRYKCRIRSPWYRVPSVYSTEIGLLKRSHDMPRLILNRIGALTTDTAYRITTNGTAPGKLVGSFINPLTALSSELEGRHYGGGVLELVPSEIEELLVPIPEKLPMPLKALDSMIKEKDATEVLSTYGSSVLSAMKVKSS
jgi:adenine-specific DNA-methyltransferase